MVMTNTGAPDRGLVRTCSTLPRTVASSRGLSSPIRVTTSDVTTTGEPGWRRSVVTVLRNTNALPDQDFTNLGIVACSSQHDHLVHLVHHQLCVRCDDMSVTNDRNHRCLSGEPRL